MAGQALTCRSILRNKQAKSIFVRRGKGHAKETGHRDKSNNGGRRGKVIGKEKYLKIFKMVNYVKVSFIVDVLCIPRRRGLRVAGIYVMHDSICIFVIWYIFPKML